MRGCQTLFREGTEARRQSCGPCSRTGCTSRALTSLGIQQTWCRSRECRLPCDQGSGDGYAPPQPRGHHCWIRDASGVPGGPIWEHPLWSLCGSLPIAPNCLGSCLLAWRLQPHSRRCAHRCGDHAPARRPQPLLAGTAPSSSFTQHRTHSLPVPPLPPPPTLLQPPTLACHPHGSSLCP